MNKTKLTSDDVFKKMGYTKEETKTVCTYKLLWPEKKDWYYHPRKVKTIRFFSKRKVFSCNFCEIPFDLMNNIILKMKELKWYDE